MENMILLQALVHQVDIRCCVIIFTAIHPDSQDGVGWDCHRQIKRIIAGRRMIGIEKWAVTAYRTKNLWMPERDFKCPEPATRNTANRPSIPRILQAILAFDMGQN